MLTVKIVYLDCNILITILTLYIIQVSTCYTIEILCEIQNGGSMYLCTIPRYTITMGFQHTHIQLLYTGKDKNVNIIFILSEQCTIHSMFHCF